MKIRKKGRDIKKRRKNRAFTRTHGEYTKKRTQRYQKKERRERTHKK